MKKELKVKDQIKIAYLSLAFCWIIIAVLDIFIKNIVVVVIVAVALELVYVVISINREPEQWDEMAEYNLYKAGYKTVKSTGHAILAVTVLYIVLEALPFDKLNLSPIPFLYLVMGLNKLFVYKYFSELEQE